ncbi:MAG TPA: tetratricopeptide repeat protein [Candidatus Latescibacteria bacterium]|jgi:tetratricopeptide (TPR) repeat protein|nr:tetratricopeptide repeat protein [Candidatus Latescibacterota bacterium]
MGLGILLIITTLGGAYFSFRSPSEKELLDGFAEAQRFYAEGAYDQAIDGYHGVVGVSSRVLDAASIAVEVGDATYPVQEAALYQVGNANRKLFTDYDRFAETAESLVRREEYAILADSALVRSARAFRAVIARASSTELRGQAFGRVIELYYDAERYPDVIDVSGQLIDTFGDSPLTKVGYYNTGWSYYEMEDYESAVAAFRELVDRFPSGFEADRSLFQIGESYLAMERYDEAIDTYHDLVGRQRLDDLDAAELERMKREKLAGLVDETALEMAAKAQIRIGTCYSRLGRYEEGLAAYRIVIERFGTERSLVEEAYLQMADLYEQRGDWDASVETYREAIRETRDRTLRARIQYSLAERLLTRGDYEPAISEYRIYLKGYGEIAQSAGFSEQRVRYRIGNAYQQWAQQADNSASLLRQGIAQYDTLLAAGQNQYTADAGFNRALALQSLETPASLAEAQTTYESLLATSADRFGDRSLVQLAKLHLGAGAYDDAEEAATRLLASATGGEYAEEAHLFQGLARQGRGDLEEAVEAFAQISAGSDLFGRAALSAGHALVTLGRYTAAVATLEAGAPVADESQLASFHYLTGQAYHALGQRADALSQFGAGLAAGPPEELAEALHLGRGNTALVADDLTTAEADFRWVVANVADPERVKFARDALAIVFLRQNRGADALAVLEQMAGSAATAEEEADLLSRTLDLYYEREDYERTVGMAQRLIDLAFDDGPTAEREFTLTEKAWYLLGDAQLRSGDQAAAVSTFDEALRLFPQGFFATAIRLNLATQQFAAGDLEAAAIQFERLHNMDLGPEQAFTVDFYLANARYSLRQFAAARDLFARLLQENPEAPERGELLFGLGESNYQGGDFGAAAGYYRQILAEYPDEPSADDAQYNLAWCLIELDQEDAAMQEFGRLIELFPDSEFAPAAQFTFGDYHYNQQRYREAIEAYERVQREHPSAPVANQVPRLLGELREALAYEDYEQGLALLDSADVAKDPELYGRAVEVFERVRRQYPGTESEIGAISNMGVCLEGLGRWRDAVGLYDEVITLYENKKATREAFQFAKAHRDWIVSTRL